MKNIFYFTYLDEIFKTRFLLIYKMGSKDFLAVYTILLSKFTTNQIAPNTSDWTWSLWDSSGPGAVPCYNWLLIQPGRSQRNCSLVTTGTCGLSALGDGLEWRWSCNVNSYVPVWKAVISMVIMYRSLWEAVVKWASIRTDVYVNPVLFVSFFVLSAPPHGHSSFFLLFSLFSIYKDKDNTFLIRLKYISKALRKTSMHFLIFALI